MAIPGYYGRWLRKHNFKNVLSRYRQKASSLSIDMNSIFHNVSKAVYSNPPDTKTPSELEQELFEQIGRAIIKILLLIRPSDLLILAVDGVAPLAKMQQQRSRRYKASLELKKDALFDSNCISPGTEFMFRLDAFLENWIKDSGTRKFLPKEIIYSGHLSPGEGEHKIFEYFRLSQKTLQIPIDPNGYHYVYGLDADLIMLSLLSPIKNIILAREDPNKGEIDLVYIDSLRLALIEHMSPKIITSGSKEVFYPINDFVILMYFFGNDFLPRMTITGTSFDLLDDFITKYISLGKPLSDRSEVILSNLSLFINLIASEEENYMIDVVNENNSLEYPSTLIPLSVINKKFSIGEFITLWYQNELKYKNLDLLNGDLKKEFLEADFNQKEIINMSLQYVTGIFWIFKYYTTGYASKYWMYKYFHAPMFTQMSKDMKSFSDSEMKNLVSSETQGPGPLEQLLIIIPRKSIKVIPGFLRSAYMYNSSIRDQLPETFIIEKDGIDKDHMAIAILPPPDILSVTQELGSMDLGPDVLQKYGKKMPLLVHNEKYLKELQEIHRLRGFLKNTRKKTLNSV